MDNFYIYLDQPLWSEHGYNTNRGVVAYRGGALYWWDDCSKQNQSKGGYEAVRTGQDLVAAAAAIRKVAQVRVEQICNISSSNMTPEIWVRLSSRVSHLMTMPNIAGVVITHGTDTLEETAFFLDLTVTGSKPVILVGTQRPPSDYDSDAPRNLLDAIRVAVSREAIGKGNLWL
jgi:L-asparaginase/Glu-tRNA(Gln) amidotransferase subunit D